jgi:hypothetical protein
MNAAHCTICTRHGVPLVRRRNVCSSRTGARWVFNTRIGASSVIFGAALRFCCADHRPIIKNLIAGGVVRSDNTAASALVVICRLMRRITPHLFAVWYLLAHAFVAAATLLGFRVR